MTYYIQWNSNHGEICSETHSTYGYPVKESYYTGKESKDRKTFEETDDIFQWNGHYWGKVEASSTIDALDVFWNQLGGLLKAEREKE